jgi:hypothetical protein
LCGQPYGRAIGNAGSHWPQVDQSFAIKRGVKRFEIVLHLQCPLLLIVVAAIRERCGDHGENDGDCDKGFERHVMRLLYGSFGKTVMQTLKVVVKQKMLQMRIAHNCPTIAHVFDRTSGVTDMSVSNSANDGQFRVVR